MTTSKKIVLLLAAQLILSASMHAMHKDDKTEADRIATLKARTKAEKEMPDCEGILGALGDPKSKPLNALRDADNKASKKKKEQAIQLAQAQEVLNAFAANQKINTVSGFDKLFYSMPKVLQQKIMAEYYQKTSQYVLRHKRELAPILYDLNPLENAGTLLNHIDRDINIIKQDVDFLLTSIHPLANAQPAIWAYSTMRNGSSAICEGPNPKSKQKVPHGAVHIAGYNDRTYNIYLNSEQLKNLMDTYSFEQISFFVSLAKIKVPKDSEVASIGLSLNQCTLFKSLDAPMQAKLEKIYWWIDFHTPNDRAMSIDDRIEWVHNKLIEYAGYWLRWAKGLPYFCKKVNK